MRLGAPVYPQQPDPDRWVAALREKGYRAAYCPVGMDAGPAAIQAYAEAARKADLVIAEVGAWSNLMASDPAEQKKALEYNQQQLALADEIGAVCCVNISGSLGERWDGPHVDNLTHAAFERVVETVRTIIDTVKPKRAFYTLEPMPWMYPDSPDSYLALLNAIDRDAFGVHLDPVNMICSPQRYLASGAFLRECFEKLGPYIKSVHAKDILLADRLTTHLDEMRPGLGQLDYRTFLAEMDKLSTDTPLMLEHLQKEEEYDLSAAYVRGVAKEAGIIL
jgi:sugar phosphate isomerase/epimerase